MPVTVTVSPGWMEPTLAVTVFFTLVAAEVVTLMVLPSLLVTYSDLAGEVGNGAQRSVAAAPDSARESREAAGGAAGRARSGTGTAAAQSSEARGQARSRAARGAGWAFALLYEHAADEPARDQQHAEQR